MRLDGMVKVAPGNTRLGLDFVTAAATLKIMFGLITVAEALLYAAVGKSLMKRSWQIWADALTPLTV